jgi:integrase
MARPKAKAPSLRYHISGQSVVTIDGRDFYLGKADSAEAFARYAVLIRVYQEHGLCLPDDFDPRVLDDQIGSITGLTIAAAAHQDRQPIQVQHLTAAFRRFVAKRYANDIQEHHRYNRLCDELEAFAGSRTVEAFGPLALQEMRQRWIEEGKARVYCNRLTNGVIRIFRWGVSQELSTESAFRRLRTIEPLRTGQTEAPETDPVVPVPVEHVRLTAAKLSPVLRAMIRVQIATGMRPSELCNMRSCEIDRSGSTWVYRPAKHKNANKKKTRAVPIIGDAREAIIDYMNRDPDAYLFSPAESYAWHKAKKRAARKTKVQPSQVDRSKPNPRKQPGSKFTAGSYRRAIQSAAKEAGVPNWHPYQLRHLAAFVVRDALGLESVQALLGHSDLKTTQRYAPPSERKAIEAAGAAPQL